MDTRYEKVRRDKTVSDSAVLLAYGVDEKGKRCILGVSVSLSESEVHWRAFLASLVERGLHGLELITSDAHAGLKAAKQAISPSVPWQRCQFHLQQNAQSYVPKKSMKKEVASDIRAVFNAPDASEAKRMLNKVVKKYGQSAPELSSWVETSVPESLTVMAFPEEHRKKYAHLISLNASIANSKSEPDVLESFLMWSHVCDWFRPWLLKWMRSGLLVETILLSLMRIK